MTQRDLGALESKLTEWLLDVSRLGEAPTQQIAGFIQHFQDAEIDLILCSSLIRTLHPQIELFAQRWHPSASSRIELAQTEHVLDHHSLQVSEGQVELYTVAHGHSDESMYRQSPFALAQETGEPVRWRRGQDSDTLKFSIIDDLAARGATEYLAMALPIAEPFEAGLSLACKHPGGFPVGFDELMLKLRPLIGLIFGFNVERLSLDEILKAYLGREPAKRVLGGQMRRGQINSVSSVIGFVNLKGYKEAIGSLDDATQNSVLDTFYRSIYDAITPHHGEILKFIGETVLFVFPLDEHRHQATCQAALSAARHLLNADAGLSGHAGSFPVQIALHYGEVLSGNIGSELRLDFTIMGHAVNLTARLHQLLPKLSERLILSKEFASAIPTPTRTLGSFHLKGVNGIQEACSLER
ncbi:MAG: adenylate/guanylate cyclase domain-containing protein [Myxococcota bacterium]|nr:adenylate/guanylate cyclase domain-containing protein [Myxococcota bacterium]